MPSRTSLKLRKAVRRARVPLGFIGTMIYLLLARPTWASLLVGLPFVGAGLGLRAYAAGTLRKFEALTTTGPYAYTRNPLYVGSLSMTIGFALVSTQWIVLVAFVALFFAIYLPTIHGEEEFLRGRYPAYASYSTAVPRLLPRLTPAYSGEESKGQFSPSMYLKNREYQALVGASAMYVALAARIVIERLA